MLHTTWDCVPIYYVDQVALQYKWNPFVYIQLKWFHSIYFVILFSKVKISDKLVVKVIVDVQ